MRVDGNLPIVSQPRQKTNTTLPAVTASSEPTPLTHSSSPIQQFESYANGESSRFSKVEGLSAFAQEALSAYQSTQSLASSNPRNLLIGVDVYA
ncbi:hypothetical protein DN730_10090 [Marinomonas piezotolerans]|uniref:Uncharacterized protein n=1 Tax=Marinomonas piezotolerans TaxID=2213058 RepID=A0A370UAC8_9GAMM|nr:hypothetical protein [Marinomonas piezotolerans]RDL44723.1 hypothetical protein DN730_10090 [Marinomonas piezotolerans]